MLTNSKGETHPTMSLTDSSYDGPILVLDPETKLYSIVYAGCQIGDQIDIVGEREKLRLIGSRQLGKHLQLVTLPNSVAPGDAPKEGT